MDDIKTYAFKPISNEKQDLHVISIAERIRKGGETVLNPHRTDFYLLIYVTSGKSSHMVDFEDIQLNKNSIIIIQPNQVHCFKEAKDYDGILVAFTESFYIRTLSDQLFLENANMFNVLNVRSKILLSKAENKDYEQIIQCLTNELSKPFDFLQHPILNKYLSNMLLYIERNYIDFFKRKGLISKECTYTSTFKKLVNKKYMLHTSVKEYAKELLISERTLQNATLAVLGKSPKSIIDNHLIVEAKRLLIHDHISIKEISYRLGFDEPTNFTKFFGKQTGHSPTLLKEKHKRL